MITPIILIKKSKEDNHGDLKYELIKNEIEVNYISFHLMFYENLLQYFKCFLKIILRPFNISTLLNICKKHDADLIYSNSSVVDVGFYIAKKLNIKHIWHIREFGVEDYNLRYFLGKKNLIKKLRESAHVIFISKAIQKNYYHGRISNSTMIYNGIINCNVLSDSIKKADPSEFNFSIVGVIMRNKGQHIALMAFKLIVQKFPEAKLNIFGNSSDSAYLKELKHFISLNSLITKVHFHGFEKNIDAIYDRTDCLLMCSVKEGLGRVTVESMARGIPVIGNDSGGTSELITNGVNGLLYKPMSSHDLANKMTLLLNNKRLHSTISKGAKRKAKDFCISEYSSKIQRLLTNI